MNLSYPNNLPILAKKEAITQAIQNNQVVIIAGETGSGKTTQLPKICLEALPDCGLCVGCTQPRRIAASSVAMRVADELGALGKLVGYKIRFQDKTSSTTRIKFMTDGVLLAETRNDKRLSQYGVVIIDEAHERNLNIDFLLGYLKTLLETRKDLKLVISSATIDTEAFAKYFTNAPVITVSGRTYPVEIQYRPGENPDEQDGGIEHVLNVVDEIFQSRPLGDILIFLPTERDIRECCALLENRYQQTIVLPLFGRLAANDQAKIFKPAKKIKIIVATNVAETSITVPAIRYVIDNDYARISQYNVRAKTTSLPISKISQASAQQRAGRAGRIGPGVCYRLYAEDDFLDRSAFTLPEIRRANLAEVILQMISLKLGNTENFPFLDPPHSSAIREGYALLRELGAIKKGNRLTRMGSIMARLPVDPCISRILLEAGQNKSLSEVTIICAVLAIQDPRIRPAEKEKLADEAHKRFTHPSSDFLSLLNIWQDFHADPKKNHSWSKLKKYCKTNYLSFQRMREWFDLQEQLFRILSREKNKKFRFNKTPASYEKIHRAILTGFLRNIARKRQEDKLLSQKNTGNHADKIKTFQASQNKELTIFPGSGLFAKPPEWILAASFIETSRLYALTVAAIEPEWVEKAAPHLCNYSWSDPFWSKKKGQVLAKERVSLFGLILSAEKKVNFGTRHKKNIAEARILFIQRALVQGEINGHYRFLDHNLALLEKWKQSEARLRIRNLIVDDQTLINFYDQRLPEDIFGQQQLNQFLKTTKNQHILMMSEHDILDREFEEKELIDFPEYRNIEGLAIRLAYTFAPGSAEDGITFYLPVNFAMNVAPHHFDWLVPGLLREKILFLLKSLAKSLRKKLVPVQTSADRILDDIEFGRGNLLATVENSILKQFRISIHRSDWKTDLPVHLCPRFVLVDDNGKEIASGRDLKKIIGNQDQKLPAATSRHTLQTPLLAKWQDKKQHNWDFDHLPREIPTYTHTGTLTGFVYPALQPDRQNNCVIIKFNGNRQEAGRICSEGKLYLFSLQFKQQYRKLKHLVSTSFSGPSTLFFGQLHKSKTELVNTILLRILEQLYGESEKTIPDNDEFFQRVNEVKKQGFFRRGQSEFEQLMKAARDRKELESRLAALSAKSIAKGHHDKEGYARLEQELAEIFPARLLDNKTDYQDVIRQLRYLSLRLERYYASPHKDEQKQKKITPFTLKMQSLADKALPTDDEAIKELQKYREMLVELKISVFAPELKKRFAVSPQKLEKQWQKIVRSHPVTSQDDKQKIKTGP